MTKRDRLVTVGEGASDDDVLALMHKHRIEKVLVVNEAFELRGLITVKDIQKARDNPNDANDTDESLLVGVAVGVGGDTEDMEGGRSTRRESGDHSVLIAAGAV